MTGVVRHISRRVYPQKVAILNDAPAALVDHRELRGHTVRKPGHTGYETNRDIKYWSTWFLLKSLTTTSLIKHWISQKEYLLHWLQMNENTFRSHIAWLKAQQLLTIDKKTKNILLCSYEKAADALDIAYTGVYYVTFNPDKHAGKQTFQYLLRTEEFEHHKQRQIAALTWKIDNNPIYKSEMYFLLSQQGGVNEARLLQDPDYFIRRLLKLQVNMFKEGSDILSRVMCYRADVNRGVKKIKEHHKYRSAQSVSYMKRRIWLLKYAQILKISINSAERGRFFIPADADTPPAQIRNGLREGYKWVPEKKSTVWFLTDQVKRLYQAETPSLNSKMQQHAA